MTPKNNPTTWIMLRGLAREKAHWGPFVDGFRARFPGDEVLPMDLPGVGEFRDHPSPRSIHEMFTFVRAQAIERARSQAQFKLVAVSLGGMIAMEWMNARPEDLGGCVLINTSASSLSPFYHRLRWQIWRPFFRLLSAASVKDRERRAVDILINKEEAREAALPLWIKIGNESPVTYVNLMNQLFAASRFRGLEQKTNVPVLLLNGLGDRFVDPSCSSALNEKWGWPLERHPWAGHDLTWDDPDWVLSRIQNWNQALDA